MAKSQPQIPHQELYGRLQTLMFLRVLFVSLLLGASIFIQIEETRTYFGYIQTSHYLLLGTVFFLTFIYVSILKNAKNLLWLAYLQLLVDTIFVTAIIYSTGGIESIFSFLYIVTIINGSIILYRRGGLVIASSSSILYGLLLDLHYYGLIHPPGSQDLFIQEPQAFSLFYLILVNIAAFYLVAYLSSYLSEQIRKSRSELRAKQVDIDKLEIINESIIKSINSGLIAVDDQHRIILFNPAAEDIFGIVADEAFGQHLVDKLPFLESHLKEKGNGLRSLTNLNPPFFDLPYKMGENEEIHLRLSVSPLRFPLEKPEGHIFVFQDITEIKKIEEEMKRVEDLALIGELAAGIAHEIRNPMASISGSIQMLKEDQVKEGVNNRLMEIVLREINRLNHLVEDFLLFARPKKAKIRPIDMNQLILESQELFKNSRYWNDTIRFVNAMTESVLLKSDPEQIKQILLNLFLNACDEMPGGGELHIKTCIEKIPDELSQEIERVEIVVRDTGNGFSKKALENLFIPFFTTKKEGSGLGLAIVKRIVEGLNGKISGKNYPEGGAEISVLLPVNPPAQFDLDKA